MKKNGKKIFCKTLRAILVDNLASWKSTTEVSKKEFYRLEKEIMQLIDEVLKIKS